MVKGQDSLALLHPAVNMVIASTENLETVLGLPWSSQ